MGLVRKVRKVRFFGSNIYELGFHPNTTHQVPFTLKGNFSSIFINQNCKKIAFILHLDNPLQNYYIWICLDPFIFINTYKRISKYLFTVEF